MTRRVVIDAGRNYDMECRATLGMRLNQEDSAPRWCGYMRRNQKREGGRLLATTLSEGGRNPTPQRHARREADCILSGFTKRQDESSTAGVLMGLCEAAPRELHFDRVGA